MVDLGKELDAFRLHFILLQMARQIFLDITQPEQSLRSDIILNSQLGDRLLKQLNSFGIADVLNEQYNNIVIEWDKYV